MPSIIWSEASRRDLRSIEAYLGARDSAAAARILRQIRATSELLERFPAAGTPLDEFRHLRVRQTPFILMYRLAGRSVEVVRVHHGRQNWMPTDGAS